jgi:hypothetical protein
MSLQTVTLPGALVGGAAFSVHAWGQMTAGTTGVIPSFQITDSGSGIVQVSGQTALTSAHVYGWTVDFICINTTLSAACKQNVLMFDVTGTTLAVASSPALPGAITALTANLVATFAVAFSTGNTGNTVTEDGLIVTIP